jgi:hypothetical protein
MASRAGGPRRSRRAPPYGTHQLTCRPSNISVDVYASLEIQWAPAEQQASKRTSEVCGDEVGPDSPVIPAVLAVLVPRLYQ